MTEQILISMYIYIYYIYVTYIYIYWGKNKETTIHIYLYVQFCEISEIRKQARRQVTQTIVDQLSVKYRKITTGMK